MVIVLMFRPAGLFGKERDGDGVDTVAAPAPPVHAARNARAITVAIVRRMAALSRSRRSSASIRCS